MKQKNGNGTMDEDAGRMPAFNTTKAGAFAE
jgi:hypothetical protein